MAHIPRPQDQILWQMCLIGLDAETKQNSVNSTTDIRLFLQSVIFSFLTILNWKWLYTRREWDGTCRLHLEFTNVITVYLHVVPCCTWQSIVKYCKWNQLPCTYLRTYIKPWLHHYLPQCRLHHQLPLFPSEGFHILMDPAVLSKKIIDNVVKQHKMKEKEQRVTMPTVHGRCIMIMITTMSKEILITLMLTCWDAPSKCCCNKKGTIYSTCGLIRMQEEYEIYQVLHKHVPVQWFKTMFTFNCLVPFAVFRPITTWLTVLPYPEIQIRRWCMHIRMDTNKKLCHWCISRAHCC